ncbi:MAG: DUF333 domain-containing protein [Candidatus Woesearchaeota archaeon]
MKKIILGLLILVLLIGCAKPQQTQISNPASTYCIEHNGTLEIKTNAEGQYGICHLQNGKECEEWAFFRNECSS